MKVVFFLISIFFLYANSSLYAIHIDEKVPTIQSESESESDDEIDHNIQQEEIVLIPLEINQYMHHIARHIALSLQGSAFAFSYSNDVSGYINTSQCIIISSVIAEAILQSNILGHHYQLINNEYLAYDIHIQIDFMTDVVHISHSIETEQQEVLNSSLDDELNYFLNNIENIYNARFNQTVNLSSIFFARFRGYIEIILIVSTLMFLVVANFW